MQQQATITEARFVHDANLKSAKRPRGRPIHSILVSFSVGENTRIFFKQPLA